jgi:WD40 repeat protein
MQDERVTSMEFSPDGQILATAITNEKDNRVRLWDWRRGQPIGDAMGGHEFALDSVTFSRDGRRIYSLSADSVGIWDAATQRSIAKLTNVRAHSAMTISQDGKRLAVAGFDYIQEFDAEDGHPVGPETRGHGQIIKDIAYSADGRYLASVGMDHTVRFWDVASRTQIGDAVDTTATGNPTDVEFSSDDRRVFITADANAVPGPTGGLSAVGGGIWELPAPPAWADELCKKLVSNPTPDQWKQWITTDPNISHRELCQGKSAPS